MQTATRAHHRWSLPRHPLEEALVLDEGGVCARAAVPRLSSLTRTHTSLSMHRRYASLFFIVGCQGKNQNELETLEFIHCLVETMDRYFER